MDIQAIVFDKDGTLADFPSTFNPATGKVIEFLSKGDKNIADRIAQVWDYDLEAKEIRDTSVIVAGSGYDITVALGSVLDIGDPIEYSRFLDRLYGEISQTTVAAISGVGNALKQLRTQGFRLGIATNDAQRNALSQMKVLGFDSYFDIVLGADSGHGAKPGPGMIEAFIAHIGLQPSQILMVGDSLHDLEAGKAANVMTCGVETGPAPRAELETKADIVLTSVAELPDWLAS